MKCPVCGNEYSKVIDSRSAQDGLSIRRRRECLGCGVRFTTYETVEFLNLMVIKRDGSRQSFDRSKLINGISRACDKRPVGMEEISGIAEKIERELQSRLEKEVKSSEIGELVMHQLKDLDEVAYVRFASVYRSFKDINTFMDELRKMLSDKESRGL